ncbi:hypothetical protein LOK49_LG14G00802 [Camellia lanceoleosa]|uniref:Uncharacterized protein n=1 Tax=Camellia lanceoleosa TaxID=1840588 RepID=A0ACC0FBI3_9ERIC|nr:hypothetical protein LOK49_LG14G00802 [Camellia lanceoleosa]
MGIGMATRKIGGGFCKYQNGQRLNRATLAGYWKATGNPDEMVDNYNGKRDGSNREPGGRVIIKQGFCLAPDKHNKIVHHSLSAIVVAYAMFTGEGQLYTFMVLISEITTPEINTRWYLDTAGLKRLQEFCCSLTCFVMCTCTMISSGDPPPVIAGIAVVVATEAIDRDLSEKRAVIEQCVHAFDPEIARST